jgi:hypothetical protein
MKGWQSLLHSRKVLIAGGAVIFTALSVYGPNIHPDLLAAIQEFGLVLIAAITIEDAAAKFKK